ncbi:MAG: hypothetical protein Q8P76_01810 [bacterium]|nr:hypothetical protein [bacterium]
MLRGAPELARFPQVSHFHSPRTIIPTTPGMFLGTKFGMAFSLWDYQRFLLFYLKF